MLNGLLYLISVVLFILAGISLLFGMFPLTVFLMILFSMCYWAMKYDGPKPKQIHLTYFNGDNEEETEDYGQPFNRDNFKLN